ncbi:response regulator [uncultured Selenomonas sp.]|uniref:response regulator n=1 Tax=uncultured Selenomonas sp. TaxID=159275 RepID=UPI00344DFA8F
MLRIVIAEDEEMIRRGLVETIDWAALGAEVVGEAADGVEALEVLRTEHPDAVFADIRMPRLSGLDFAEKIRAAGDDTPIILWMK